MFDRELIQGFLEESQEFLDNAEQILSAGQGGSVITAQDLSAVFRAFHSLKGNAGALGFANINRVTHEAETLLDLQRSRPDPDLTPHIDLLFATLDLLRSLLGLVDQSNHDQGLETRVQEAIAGLQAAVAAEKGQSYAQQARIPAAPERAAPAAAPGTVGAKASGATAAERGGAQPAELRAFLPAVYASHARRSLADFLRLIGDDAAGALAGRLPELLAYLADVSAGAKELASGDIRELCYELALFSRQLAEGRLPAVKKNLGVVRDLAEVLDGALAGVAQGGDGAIPNIDIYCSLIGDILAEHPAAADPVAAAPAPAGQGQRLVVVDDEKTVAAMLDTVLRHHGFQCALFTDALQALAHIENSPAELIDGLVCDIRMPDLDGRELIARVRALLPSLPVLAISAYGDRELIGSVLEAGADDYLDKPFSADCLVGKVREVLGKGHARAEFARRQAEAPPPPSPAPAKQLADEAEHPAAAARRDIRVSLAKLESLFALVGELVIAESLLTGHPQIERLKTADGGIWNAANQLHALMGELQESVMSLRMMPVAQTFRKLRRIVHDLCAATGKQAILKLRGEETEIDKSALDLLGDPLMHMVRNAVDHGIEKPEARLAAGKPATGTIVLEARHEAGEIRVEMRDDGAGMNRDKILAKARERGLLDAGAQPADEEIFKLIFEPGFSTAAAVTSVSGRGVGMDVVKRNVEQIGGTIHVESAPGKGSSITLGIPLTMALLETMIVRCGTERYLIPLNVMRETFLPGSAEITRTLQGREMARLRDEVLPVKRLAQSLRVPAAGGELQEGLLLAMDSRRGRFALFVDEIVGTMEAVVKGLPSYIGPLPGIYGCSILGDGAVALILDAATLPEALPETTGWQPALWSAAAAATAADFTDNELGRDNYLSFTLDRQLYGLPLEKVREIIIYHQQAITRLPGVDGCIRGALNIRGSVLPVMDARQRLAMPQRDYGYGTCIIVVEEGGHHLGLAVDRVSEVRQIGGEQIERPAASWRAEERRFLHGISKHSGAATLILDARRLLFADAEPGTN